MNPHAQKYYKQAYEATRDVHGNFKSEHVLIGMVAYLLARLDAAEQTDTDNTDNN
jgi:hypothetical protein